MKEGHDMPNDFPIAPMGRYPDFVILPDSDSLDDQTDDLFLPEESYYVNQDVYSRLLPSEIHQPSGKIYKG